MDPKARIDEVLGNLIGELGTPIQTDSRLVDVYASSLCCAYTIRFAVIAKRLS